MTEITNEDIKSSQGRKIFFDYLSTEFQDKNSLIESFDKLTELYFQVNSVTNISALRNIDDVYIKHYLDSVYPHKYFSGTVCDVGCGGGFPTIPLSITTGLQITGVDSVGKKLLLIHRCVTELCLKNLKADYARSEDLIKLHRTYDTVCARALADTNKSLAFCAPLAKQNGQIVLYKTQNDVPADKNKEVEYNVSLIDTVDYILPGTDIKRRLFIYKKF